MSNDEYPKDYSSLYREAPKRSITLDGARSTRATSESTVNLRAVAAKLQNLPQANRSAYAIDTLNKHYSTVFANRKKPTPEKVIYKVHIRYFDEDDTYVVRLTSNRLRDVKDKLPKRGDYRYFFKHYDQTCVEVEQDDDTLPFHDKGDSKFIYCRVFPII